MKAIIDGKRYNTQTATSVADAGHGYGGDFDRYEETLYRTARGTWFLAGNGGPRTRYARPVDGNMTGGGEGIFPLTEEEAREWLESHQCVEELEEHFGPDLVDA